MNKKILAVSFFIFIIGLLVLLKIFVFRIIPFVNQYFFTSELDLSKRYGKGSWVLITGASSGMGERFAHEFADRGFNLLLIGSKRTKRVIRSIKNKVQIKFIEKDFSNSFEENFFYDIQQAVDDLGSKWTILINNVGYRAAALHYIDMPIEEMKKTISVGTLVQAKLTQMAIQKFKEIKSHTAIVNITAQHTIHTDLFALDKELTVPHLACYEATNVWGYCHAKSVYEEIKYSCPQIDFLIITPGPVITPKTDKVLHNTLFAVDVDVFIKNILKLMGNYQGPMCAYLGHSFSDALVNIFPFVDKESITKKVGMDFANSCTNLGNKQL
jgi:short-subunit dehydrogenase